MSAEKSDLVVLEATANAGLRTGPMHVKRLVRIARAAAAVAAKLGSNSRESIELHAALSEVMDSGTEEGHAHDCEKWWRNGPRRVLNPEVLCTCGHEGSMR